MNGGFSTYDGQRSCPVRDDVVESRIIDLLGVRPVIEAMYEEAKKNHNNGGRASVTRRIKIPRESGKALSAYSRMRVENAIYRALVYGPHMYGSAFVWFLPTFLYPGLITISIAVSTSPKP